MRKRIISPEFWYDEKIVELSFGARLLFIALWQMADDEGRMEYAPKRMGLQIFPSQKIDIVVLCAELRQCALVCTYKSEDRDYLEVINFRRWQKFDKRRPSKYPAPTRANLRQSADTDLT